MSKRNSMATSADVMEDSYEAIDRDLADIAERLNGATKQEMTELTAGVGLARLRMIAVARAKGGAAFARLMRTVDESISGDNVVRFRRGR